MWISGNSTPDFGTINNCRGQRIKHHIHDLFAEVVKRLQALQVLSLDIEYMDGTKIASAANNYILVGESITFYKIDHKKEAVSKG